MEEAQGGDSMHVPEGGTEEFEKDIELSQIYRFDDTSRPERSAPFEASSSAAASAAGAQP